VDPVGACVGQKGVRVQTVTDELNGQEKIDIIQWNENPKIFIVSALSPAKVVSVEIDEKTKKAAVTVEESQAPLAIGKGGVNVNLAARLAGYDIDIVQLPSEKPPVKEEKTEEAVPTVETVTEKVTEESEKAPSETPQETQTSPVEEAEKTEEAQA
jgi:N utilization substance protein A